MKWNKTNSLGIGILDCLQIIPSERSLEPLYYSSFVFSTLVYGVIGINFVDHFLNQGAPAEHKSAETSIGHESGWVLIVGANRCILECKTTGWMGDGIRKLKKNEKEKKRA